MSSQWVPSGPWMAKFRKALFQAFTPQSLEVLTSDYFGPSRAFFVLIGNQGDYEYHLHELIQQARMDDWLLDLVAAARERRPKNKEIADIAEDIGLTIAGPRLVNSTGKPLEELVQRNAKFLNLENFLAKLGELQGQVCRINIPGGGGTGFLVGPDLVVTNQHVVERIRANETNWRNVTCLFDYRQGMDGSVLTAKKKIEIKLHSENWLMHSRPPSQFDLDPTMGNAGQDEADYALIRLEERIGAVPVGGDTPDTQASPRHWISTDADVTPLIAGNQVFLLQHPKGEPLQLTVGTVKEFNAAGTRVRYDANSKGGSSGSPCFNADLQLVALHHARDPEDPPKWNQAIPFSLIQKIWRENEISLS